MWSGGGKRRLSLKLRRARGEDRELFNEEDHSWITAFLQLSVDAKKLYVRLFQRKLIWLKVNKLDYAEIGLDLIPYIREMGKAGLLQTESDLQDVSESLDLLSGPEMKVLAKRFLVPGSGRRELMTSLLRLSRQRSLFGGLTSSTTGSMMMKRAKELAGNCVRVARAPRAVLSRLLLLFSLTDAVEEEASSGQNQMSTVLLVNMGRVTFPQYKVARKTTIFRNRDDLIRYETAGHALRDVKVLMESGHWEDALELYKNSRDEQSQAAASNDSRFDRELPVYLRCFTAGWVHVRLRSHGVEILQRLRLYQEAVEELRALLAQTVYCAASRGRWWDRLALNLHQHLKQTEQAVHCILEGLDDGHVRPGHRLALHQRATRLRDSPGGKKWQPLLLTLPASSIGDVPHVTVKGKLCPQTGTGNSFFLLETAENINSLEKKGDGAMVICSVEQLALAHYRQQGFDQGIHGEGATFTTLFGLLFWDIIFMDGIPDVFRNSYQAFPLDLYTDCFYTNRREAVDSRLELVREASPLTLQSLIADVWRSQEGKATPLVTWQLFSSLQQAQSLVSSLGGAFLSGVCERLVKDLRHYRAGLPDLVVWNSNSFKFAEVKGPNDRLSPKQTVWLHELRQLGAEVEVCHVTAVGARSTRLS
eukprot:gi/632939207/ref/XP_007908186.1/ PREDICTED: fanconi-associated nuclease 1 [Callorhinchus milii]